MRIKRRYDMDKTILEEIQDLIERGYTKEQIYQITGYKVDNK